MNGIETLKTLNVNDISAKTFIPIEEVAGILECDYGMFNRPKAIGFAAILEREYDVDMSEWLEGHELYLKENIEEKEGAQIFVVATDEKGSASGKVVIIIFLALLAALGVYGLMQFQSNDSNTLSEQSTSPIIEEASKALPATPSSQMSQEPIEETSTPELPVFDKSKVEPVEASVQASDESSEEEMGEHNSSVEPVEASLYIESRARLWVGVKYLDGSRGAQRIIDGRFDLDPEKNQELIFGHGKFTLYYNGQAFIPAKPYLKTGYRIVDGKVTEFKPRTIRKKERPSAQDDPKSIQKNKPQTETVESSDNEKSNDSSSSSEE